MSRWQRRNDSRQRFENDLGNVLGNAGFRQRLQSSCRGAGTGSFDACSPITLAQQTHWQH